MNSEKDNNMNNNYPEKAEDINIICSSYSIKDEPNTRWTLEIYYESKGKYYKWTRWADRVDGKLVDSKDNISLEEYKFGKLFELCLECDLDKIFRHLENDLGFALDARQKGQIIQILIAKVAGEPILATESIVEYLTSIHTKEEWESFYRKMTGMDDNWDDYQDPDSLAEWYYCASMDVATLGDTEEKKLFAEVWGNNTYSGEECMVVRLDKFRLLKAEDIDDRTVIVEFSTNGDKHRGEYTPNLFYNEPERNQIDSLIASMSEERPTSMTSEYQNDKGKITCLLHGEEDSGKNSTVRMLARSTGRPLLIVDQYEKWMPNYPSWLIGKCVKGLFNYYQILSQNGRTPIMYIQALDTIGSRISDETALKMFREHFVKELEHFNGVLFATAIQTNSIDETLPHQFTYDIHLHYPDAENREKIWVDRIPVLSVQEAKKLAVHELNGGQIADMADKYGCIYQDIPNAYNKLSKDALAILSADYVEDDLPF